MIKAFDFIRELTTLSVGLRLLAAVVCGGLVGLEREYKRRPAGLRTHILICIGAAMTALTSQYLALAVGANADITRLGAQVVAGVGFIGAGTIILTKHNRIKGLTTAAGLWVCAIIGLGCGMGYLECALGVTAVILFAELVLARLEYRVGEGAAQLNVFLEYEGSALTEVLALLDKEHIRVTKMEVIKSDGGIKMGGAVLSLLLPAGSRRGKTLLGDIAAMAGVHRAEEL